MQGVVRRVLLHKSIGFITVEGVRGDCYFDERVLQGATLADLSRGQPVEVTLGEGGTQFAGPRAAFVTVPAPARRLAGTIAKLVPERDHGFIAAPEEPIDFFFHCSMLRDTTMAALRVGLRVTFDPRPGDGRGPRAAAVRVVEE